MPFLQNWEFGGEKYIEMVWLLCFVSVIHRDQSMKGTTERAAILGRESFGYRKFMKRFKKY